MNTSLRMAKKHAYVGGDARAFFGAFSLLPPPLTWQACAHFGATCSGTDIDVRVLKGRKGRNVFTNFGARVFSLGVLVRGFFQFVPVGVAPVTVLVCCCVLVFYSESFTCRVCCREGTRLPSTVL